ncbi:MAG: division/cell wall cluster transcriptional repressor MraZ [Chloroflexi bacterium]|nr:MAG: division/cell wall cluster transcriptional repressor MraZ [Chloroflexota bacterium]
MERRIFRRSGFKGAVEHMFLGQYQHSFDNKGRLTIPSRFRELLAADGAYVTQGFDRNLMVLTVSRFERISGKVEQMSMTEPNARMLKRMIFSSANMVEVDKAGRILIPEFLRQYAGLQTLAVVVGAGDYFEIWAPETWTELLSKLQDADTNGQRFALLEL